MKFTKKINNNVALVQDASGMECIVIGKGIGFSKKFGDSISDQDITRRFLPAETESLESILQNLVTISPDILSLASEISRSAERKLDIKFSNHQYIILADHIEYAIERSQEGTDYNESARWEIKKLYPREHIAALEAITLIEKRLNVSLPKSEEVFITYHFVNAHDVNNQIGEVIKSTKLMGQVLDTIEEQFDTKLDEEDFNYIRLINHLRYYFIRKLHGENSLLDPGDMLSDEVNRKCPGETKTVDRIAEYLKENADISMTKSEKMFLTLHIWRVVNAIVNKVEENDEL